MGRPRKYLSRQEGDRLRYAERKKIGQCVDCTEDAEPEKARCKTHLGVVAEAAIKWKVTNGDLNWIREQDISLLSPAEAEYWQLRCQGLGARVIAVRLGVSLKAVHNAWQRARDRFIGRMEKAGLRRAPNDDPDDTLDDTSGERCRCGLRLPCNDCTSIYKVIDRRRHFGGGIE